jgi:hypothetical protein
MFKSKWNIVLVLAACALLLSTTVSAKKQVTRPFTIRGDVTVISDFLTQYYASATGVATHIGKYSGSAEVFGKAILIAANGDELYWTEEIVPDPSDPFTFTMSCTITGGTGRFEGASGSFGPVTVTVDVDPITGVITFSYSASGTIKY